MHVTQICLTYWLLPSWIINEFANTRSKADIYVWHWQKKNDDRKNCESSFNTNHWNCFFFILQTFCFLQNLLRTILYGKRLMWNWELSLREQASTIIKSIYRNLLSVHLTFFLFFYLLFEILHWCACCAVNKEEKSLRHCNLGSKIFGWQQSENSPKREFAPFQTSSILFNFI